MPNPVPQNSWKANGTIAPCRVCTTDNSGDNLAVQATADTQVPIGVSQEGTRIPPGTPGYNAAQAALAGEQIEIIGALGRCRVEIGAAVTRMALCSSDANGRVVTATAPTFPLTVKAWIVGMAMTSGAVVGERINFLVMPQPHYR